MGSVVSSDNEGCSHESWEKFSRTAKCVDCGHTWPAPEPPGSASSSPDEPTVHDRCGRCPHERRRHIGGGCILCPEGEDRHAFVLAEPEAPEEPPCPSCGQQAGTWFDRSVCAEPCGSAHDRCSNRGAVTGDACLNEMEASPPQRFPFTLTYALASGERREVTLAGDVAVRLAEDGALIITHESLIRALTEIRPNKDNA